MDFTTCFSQVQLLETKMQGGAARKMMMPFPHPSESSTEISDELI
jgi:hypothetical protein